MGVWLLLAHLLITLVLIGGYLYTVLTGAPDVTLQNIINIVVGYWFGALGADKMKQFKKQREENK